MKGKKYNLSFTTAYSQVYLVDKNSPFDTGSEEFWTTEAYEARLAIEDGVLGVSLGSYGIFKCELYLLESEYPHLDMEKYDHVVEAGLEVCSGKLQVLDCPHSSIELEVEVIPGKYRVRIYSLNLSAARDNDQGGDHYIIQMWPDDHMERKVLTQWKGLY